jgi:drug/metabolite transporter (DMT)-like permease
VTFTLSAEHDRQMRVRGLVFVVMSAIAFSVAGILTKTIQSDVWVIGSWRGFVGGLLIVGYVYLRAKRRSEASPFRLGWRGWVLASLIAGSGLAFVAAFKLTYVANVTVIVAAVPFVTAFIEWAFLRQRVPNATLFAAVLCVVGILVMVGGSVGSINLLGDTFAVVMIILQAMAMVLVRVFKNTPVFFAIAIGGFQVCIIGLMFSNPFDVSFQDAILLTAFGLSFAAAAILMTEGLKLISATEAGLLGTTEAPIAIFLAWVFLAELPPVTSFAGGTVILAAVVWHILRNPQKN